VVVVVVVVEMMNEYVCVCVCDISKRGGWCLHIYIYRCEFDVRVIVGGVCVYILYTCMCVQTCKQFSYRKQSSN